MSLFRVFKYSSILFFLGKYKDKLFRVIAVLLFAAVTSLLYQDIADYLAREHPGMEIYALVAKILIVYGALVFVLWQFKPQPDAKPKPTAGPVRASATTSTPDEPVDRLSRLADVDAHSELKSRYDRMLEKSGKGD